MGSTPADTTGPDGTRDLALRVPGELRRGDNRNEETSVREASALLAYMAEAVGRSGLDGARILDIGCGVKFTQALLTDGTPIGRYVGVDVFEELIAHLQSEVDDPRFSFVPMDTHNEMYNPEGRPLDDDTVLPLDEEFDIVCGFSLFTHLAPHDYVHMLRLMRRYVAPDGRLFITLFVNERTAGGHGLIDAFAAGLERNARPDDGTDWAGETPAFCDFTPSKPLLHAMYSRPHALALMEGTGWEPIELRDPLEDLQHHVVCRPV